MLYILFIVDYICAVQLSVFLFCFFNVTATSEIYTYLHMLPLHDALPSFGQQFVGHRQHQFGVPARRDLAAGDQFVAVDQGDGAGFGGGFDREQVHDLSMIAAGGSVEVGTYAYQSMRRVRYIIKPTITSSTSAPISSAYCSAAISPYSIA